MAQFCPTPAISTPALLIPARHWLGSGVMDPDGRIAVVTGAGGGIGGALVRALVAAGAAAVIATDVEAPPGFAAPVTARALDVTDEEATTALVADIEDSVGPLDLWFANAGVAGGGGPD